MCVPRPGGRQGASPPRPPPPNRPPLTPCPSPLAPRPDLAPTPTPTPADGYARMTVYNASHMLWEQRMTDNEYPNNGAVIDAMLLINENH